jgi:tetratricopeptide (TPR) repeat protein
MARRKRPEPDEGDETAASARPARERHLRVPPPLTEGSEPFEGGEILDELEGELGGLLWNSLRTVTLWGRARPARREEMAAPALAQRRMAELDEVPLPETLQAPLRVLARVLSEPTGVDPVAVAAACRSVAEWANAQGMLGTALAFLQAAALAHPEDAGLSYAVGRMARRHGEPTRAESWLQYAIAHARRNRDWATYTMSYAGLGNLYAERGNFPQARRALTTAVRTARRQRLAELEALISHDLFALAAETGRVREAERLAGVVLELYGPGHPRLAHLAHDLAYLWLERGEFGNALAVFLSLERHIHENPARILMLTSTVRAAGGAGDREAYARTWETARAELGVAAGTEGQASAWLNMAHAAASMGEVERARQAARGALDAALKMREGKQRLAAEALIERLERAPAAEPHTVGTRRPAPERLVEQLVSYLTEPAPGAARGA